MLSPALILLIETATPLLIEQISILIRDLRDQRADSNLYEAVLNITTGIQKSHPEWDSTTKRQWAFDAIKLYAIGHNINATDSTLNRLIELAVPMAKGQTLLEGDVI